MSRSIAITGASSGIGRALALTFARERATLALLGRNPDRLDDVAARCSEQGAAIRVGVMDVRDRAQMAAWLEDFDAASPIDLLVVNAGVTGGTVQEAAFETADVSRALLETNVLGALNTIHPILPRMMARRSGQIAIMSSIAAFVPLPETASYAASKAALLHYGLALRASTRAFGVRINVVCPGYVTTPMNENTAGWKPLEMSAETAAERIRRGLARDKAVISFPLALAMLARVGGLLPETMRCWAVAPFGFKVSKPR